MENKKAPHQRSEEQASGRMRSKDSYFFNEKKQFFNYLQKNTATASMAADALNIPQKNITRYKRQLEKVGKLKEVCKTICRKTKRRAAYLTTNSNLLKTLL